MAIPGVLEMVLDKIFKKQNPALAAGLTPPPVDQPVLTKPSITGFVPQNNMPRATVQGKPIKSISQLVTETMPENIIPQNNMPSPMPENIIPQNNMPNNPNPILDFLGGVGKSGLDLAGQVGGEIVKKPSTMLEIAAMLQPDLYGKAGVMGEAQKAQANEQAVTAKIAENYQNLINKMAEAGQDPSTIYDKAEVDIKPLLVNPGDVNLGKKAIMSGYTDNEDFPIYKQNGKIYNINGIEVKAVKKIPTDLDEFVNKLTIGESVKLNNRPAEIAQDLAKEKELAVFKAGLREDTLKKLPAGEATQLADQQTAIDLAKDLLPKALKMDGLSFSPADILLGVNPYSTGVQAYKQILAVTKQIIGKGLEGGVLRAEDEKKYSKILPVLGDTKEVLEAKTSELQSMLRKKYLNTLSSLHDAGYDVDKFIGKNNQISKKLEVIGFDDKIKKVLLSDGTKLPMNEAREAGYSWE